MQSQSQARSSWRYVIEPLDLNEAVERILSSIAPLQDRERVHLDEADGRVAAVDVSASVSLPPFPSSAMDGIAVRWRSLTGSPPHELRIVGESRAGHPYRAADLAERDCIRIFTGAAIPADLDTVIIQEDCEFRAPRSSDDKLGYVLAKVHPECGDNVRAVGHDVKPGEPLVSAGEQLNPFSVGWLGACGITHLEVIRRPTVSIFATGDELVEAGGQLGPGQIYESNRILLRRLLARLPVNVKDLGSLPDDPEKIATALVDAARSSNMLITSAGVSVGDADFVTQVLQEIGTLELWRLRIKPGKPLAYGHIGSTEFFGLPGNPVSTVVTFLTVVRPALFKLCGATAQPLLHHPATLADPIAHKPGREEFQRGRLIQSDGKLLVHVTGDQSSNRLASFRGANCLIRVPKTCGDLDPGSEVAVLPFSGLL